MLIRGYLPCSEPGERMPRERYRTITVREDVYQALSRLADARGVSIGELVAELVNRYAGGERQESMVVDFVGDLAVEWPSGVELHVKPVVELDETDHLVFRCPWCGVSLVVARLECFRESGEIVFMMFCPRCGHVFRRKCYAAGYSFSLVKRVNDIPRAALRVLKSRAGEVLEEVGPAVIASIAPSRRGVCFRKRGACIEASVLEFPLVRDVLGYYGVSRDFFVDYPRASGDERLVLVGEWLCFSYEYFAWSYRRVLVDLVKTLEPVRRLGDGTLVYEFTTNFYNEPGSLLKPLYCYSATYSGLCLSGMDVLRSLYLLTTIKGFDVMEECMGKMMKRLDRAESYNELLELARASVSSCTRYGELLLNLWREAGALAVFTHVREKRRTTIRVAMAVKPS